MDMKKTDAMFFFCRFLSECASGLILLLAVVRRPLHLDFYIFKIQMGGTYGEVCTKKSIYQRKQCLCGVIPYGFLPPQANRPELHGQAVYPRAGLSDGFPILLCLKP